MSEADAEPEQEVAKPTPEVVKAQKSLERQSSRPTGRVSFDQPEATAFETEAAAQPAAAAPAASEPFDIFAGVADPVDPTQQPLEQPKPVAEAVPAASAGSTGTAKRKKKKRDEVGDGLRVELVTFCYCQSSVSL